MSKYFLEEGGGLSLGYLVVEKKFPIRYDIADANLGIGDSMASVVDPHPGIEPLDIDCQSMPTMLTDNGRWLPDAADESVNSSANSSVQHGCQLVLDPFLSHFSTF